MGLFRRIVGTTAAILGMGMGVQASANVGLEQQRAAIVAEANPAFGNTLNAIRDSTHYVARNLRSPKLAVKIANNAANDAEKAFTQFKSDMPHTNQANIQSMRWMADELQRLANAVTKLENSQETGPRERLVERLTRLADDISRAAR